MVKISKSLTLILFSFLVLFSLTANASDSIKTLINQGPVAGNPKGDVTIVEFFDYQCSHCVSMSSVINDIIRANPNVRVVFKDFPIRGPLSEYAARAAIAANAQGKYFDFSHALLRTYLPLSQDTILNIAKTSGLNVTKLKKDMDSANVINELKTTYKLAIELKLMGTPAFYIGKTNAKNISDMKFVFGEMSQKELQEAIQSAQQK